LQYCKACRKKAGGRRVIGALCNGAHLLTEAERHRPKCGHLAGFDSPIPAQRTSNALASEAVADTPTDSAWNDLRALVEQVEDYAMFVLDLEGHVASWNRGAQKIKGYAAHEIIGQHFSKFYLPEEIASQKPQQKLAEALATGHVEDEGWRVRADGSRFWAFVSITLLRDAYGAPKGFGKVTRDLTERRNAQEQLRGSEERFRLLVEGVTDYAIYMLDPHGVVATWNSGAQKIKGYSSEQIIGREFSLFFTPEDRAAGRPQKELAIARNEGRFEEEGWRVRADGSRFWASVVVTALRARSGELVGFTKVTRDLTAKKEAEDTARQRERFQLLSQQLDVILEGVVDGITVQDRRGKLVFVNSSAARQTGLASREELLNIEGAELFKRFEMRDEHGQAFPLENLPGRRVLAGERTASALIRTRDRQDGREWWSQIRANAVLGEDGLPELAVNIWHDVSQKRRREEHERYLNEATTALSKSLDYRATLAKLADVLVPGLCDWCAIHLLEGAALKIAAIVPADPEQKKRAEQYQRNYPPNPDETAGVWQVLRTGVPILHEDVLEEALLENAPHAEQLEQLKADGIRSVIFVPIKLRDQVSGTLTLVSAETGRRYDDRDLRLATELGRRIGTFIENALLYERAQRAAESAEAAAREAEAAGRLKDEFLATVSHELRTPLNAILGWSSVLKARAEPALVAKGVAVINRNAAAQSKIIEDILDVSRIITGKLRLELRPVDLVGIVGDAIEVVRPSALAREIRIGFERPAEPAFLVGDTERLQQVMWNLLSNAVKFTDPGGHVEVKLDQRGSQLSVMVVDDGKGIDLAFLPYVFERFKQADSSTTRRFGGLGLGLAIVRHIVELHGGRVAATSAGPGQGSAFEVVFPVHAVALAAEEPPASTRSDRPRSQPPSSSLEGLRVLVVDDEADARDLLELVLSQAGAKVRTANSAAVGLAALLPFQPQVIVSDIGMADEDGYAFMRRIRSMQEPAASTPAIALTAYTRNEDKLKALAMGFSVHLGKPVNPDDLTALVAKLAKRAAQSVIDRPPSTASGA
jgi:PAS domain S-box-containing protein